VQLGDKTGYAMTDQVKAISTQRLQRMHPKTLATEDVDRVKFALRRMIDFT
jgi:mRNA interferase MazF